MPASPAGRRLHSQSPMQTIRVNLGPRSYDIAIGHAIENQFAGFVRARLPR